MRSYQDETATPKSTTISVVGEAKIKNPIKFGRFVEEDDAVLVNISKRQVEKGTKKSMPKRIYFEPAGPRDKVYFDTSKDQVCRGHLRRTLSRSQ